MSKLKLKSLLKESKSVDAADLPKNKQELLNKIAKALDQKGYDELRDGADGIIVAFEEKVEFTKAELKSLVDLSIKGLEFDYDCVYITF